MSLKNACFLALSLTVGSLLAAPGQAQVVSNFDFSSEGWLILGDNDAEWTITGGNPGGCYNVNDLATGQLNIAAAPAKFLGDWSSLGVSETLSFDVYFENTSGRTLVTPDWMFEIKGPGGVAKGIVPGYTPPELIYSQYSVSLDPLDWVVESGTWAALLDNVTSLKLQVEYVDGDEIVRIDNVRLSGTPGTVFRPCEASDFNGTGIDDWSYQNTGTVSNPGDDGNGGGYLQVKDKSGVNSYVFAPARFLGDWTAFNNSGYVTVDLRVVSSSGVNEGAPEFIRISGPGGGAHVSLAPGELPTLERIWKTFEYPLNASTWTLDSGTWPGLLANVTDCRIDAEFFDGTETIGLDNFGRLLNSCPPIDAPVTVRSPDITLCETHSFIDAGCLGFNPADGWLYATARETVSGQGGVYVFPGLLPVVKLHSYEYPAGLLFDDDGDGYLSEDYDGEVNRFVGAESTSIWVSVFHSSDDDPFGMTFAPPGFNGANVNEGDILVVDRGNSGADQIWAFSPDTANGERLVKPDPGTVDWFDLTADDMGRVWVIDALDPNYLFQLHPDGSFTNLTLSTPITGMRGIAFDPVDDMFYVVAGGAQALYRVNPVNGVVTLMADGFQGVGLANLALSASLRRLWLSDTVGERIYEFCLPGWTAADPGPGFGRQISLRATPNPFLGATEVSFTLPAAAEVELSIYDVTGGHVYTLSRGQLAAGPHVYSWDGHRANGERTGSGVYFLRLRINQGTTISRVTLLR